MNLNLDIFSRLKLLSIPFGKFRNTGRDRYEVPSPRCCLYYRMDWSIESLIEEKRIELKSIQYREDCEPGLPRRNRNRSGGIVKLFPSPSRTRASNFPVECCFSGTYEVMQSAFSCSRTECNKEFFVGSLVFPLD